MDIYVNGVLLKKRASQSFLMVTPNLPSGLFKYELVIRDSYDSTKSWKQEIRGIVAGKTINLDLRELT